MKKTISKTKLYLAIAIIISVVTIPFGYAISKGSHHHKPITQKLINLLDKNPEIRHMLEKSISEAKKNNPDPKTNPAQSLSEFYDYLDQAVEQPPNTRIGSDIHYICFLADQPLPELEGKGLYKNALQYYPPFASWMREFAIARGAFLNTEKSWNEKIYEKFYNDPRFGLQKDWYENPANWKTWNQFFSRYLKSPDARPIASPDDPSVVVAPADSVPQGIWQIDKDSNIKVENGLKVKNDTYYSVKDLLGKDSKYKEAFANGILTHSYLSPSDYHRYHFAVGGVVKEKKIIPGNVACPSKWNPEKRTYDAVDLTGWQFTQTRGYVIVDTGKYGVVALIPVGMDLVSSVNFEGKVKVGATFKKGDMLGTFLFGGSDFIMLFQEKAGFEITAPREDKASYKHILMGEKYGVMKGPTAAKSSMAGQPTNLQIVPQKFKEAAGDYKIEMVYPKVKGMKDVNIQKLINRQVRRTIEEKRIKFLKERNKPFNHFINTMSGRYEVIGLTPNYLSIKIKTEVMYAGAAHPQHWSDSLNFDLKTGRIITLPQIFKADSGFLKIVADYCAKELLSRPELNADKEWVQKGTAPILSNYKIFNLSNKALLFTFSEYQVGPYAVGEPVVEISFDKLRPIIKY